MKTCFLKNLLVFGVFRPISSLRRLRADSGLLILGLSGGGLLGWSGAASSPEELGKTGKPEAGKPRAFEEVGKLTCLLEEMKKLHGTDVPPVHDHLLGFQVEGAVVDGEMRYWTIIRNSLSEALFADLRFQRHALYLAGRIFPGAGLLEIQRFNWVREGKFYEVYYWCEVCSIKGVNPGACACCQAPVELRERLIPEAEWPAKVTSRAVPAPSSR